MPQFYNKKSPNKNSLLKVIAFVVFAAALSLLWPLGIVTAKQEKNEDLYKQLKLLTDVLAIVENDYVRPVGSRELVEGAIKGLLTTLDPHSGYLDPEFYQDLQVQTKGEFGGLGIEITVRDGQLIVVSPMEDSPAARAGVRAGDYIVKIDGKFAKDFTLFDAVKTLRGPKGSTVVVTVQRKGDKNFYDFSIVRDNIQVKSVRSRSLGDGYGYIRINQFVEKTTDDVKAALKNIYAKNNKTPLKGLVIDMRNNPGGLLTQAVGVSDLFLKEGVIVYTDGRIEGQRQKFFAQASGTEPEYPIVVLVNGGSASASEIVAGSLKDHGRALVLGTQTFGKGSVQTITPLANGGALTLTTALYYTKSGRSLQALGVTPDIELEFEEQVEAPKGSKQNGFQIREGDLPGAIANPSDSKNLPPNLLLEQKPAQPSEDNSATEKIEDLNNSQLPLNIETDDLELILSKDNQLKKAVELLKGFDAFKKDPASALGKTALKKN